MRVLIRCIAFAPLAVLVALLVVTSLFAEWLEERAAARDGKSGVSHA